MSGKLKDFRKHIYGLLGEYYCRLAKENFAETTPAAPPSFPGLPRSEGFTPSAPVNENSSFVSPRSNLLFQQGQPGDFPQQNALGVQQRSQAPQIHSQLPACMQVPPNMFFK